MSSSSYPEHLPPQPLPIINNTPSSAQLTCTGCYLFSAVACLVFVAFDIHEFGFRLSIRLCYNVALFFCFLFRTVYFVHYAGVVSVNALVWVSMGFLMLMVAKVLALCAWHQCGNAFTAIGADNFEKQTNRFRWVVATYLVTLTFQTIGMLVWIFVYANGNADALLVDFQTGQLQLTMLVFFYWFGAHNSLLGLSSFILGMRLFLRTKAHGFQRSVKINKLRGLSIGAAVICISFTVRAGFDLLAAASTEFDTFCLSKYYDSCLIAFFLGTEWVPNFYFQGLLFVLAFYKRRRNRRVHRNLSTSTPLESLCSQEGGGGGLVENDDVNHNNNTAAPRASFIQNLFFPSMRGGRASKDDMKKNEGVGNTPEENNNNNILEEKSGDDRGYVPPSFQSLHEQQQQHQHQHSQQRDEIESGK